MTLRAQAGRGWRPWIAVIAAYVFVLQTLLAAVAVTQATASTPAADLSLVICTEHTAAADTAPDKSGSAALCVHCAACVNAGTAPLLPQAGAVSAVRFPVAAHVATKAFSAPTPASLTGPRSSRGPPRIA